MNRYDTYKDSGVKWIGEIPSHWERCRFKNFMYLKSEKSTSSVKIGLENIESGTGRYITSDSEFDGDGVGFTIDDIVYGKLRPYLRKVWQAEFEGNAVGDFYVFTSRNNSLPSYIKYLMLSDGFTKESNGSTFGAKMPRVASEFILTLPFYLPPRGEQLSIANYLDTKCNKIDKVIATQEKRVELFRELKQSVITRAVTRGINPDAKLKDSGVEWIGEIPEYWGICKLKSILSLLTDGTHVTPEYKAEGIPFISIKDMSSGKIDFSNTKYIDQKTHIELSKHANVQKGDIIFSRIGTLGVFIKVDTDTIFDIFVSLGLMKVVAGSIDKDYLVYYLSSNVVFNYISLVKVGGDTSAAKFNLGDVANTHVLLPSLEEQHLIVEYLNKRIQKLDSSIQKALRQIELLKEYKQSLITEVVTGKRKVV